MEGWRKKTTHHKKIVLFAIFIPHSRQINKKGEKIIINRKGGW